MQEPERPFISRPNLCASGSCRALRACLLAVPVAFCEGLRPPQKPSSTAEVKIADGRFRVGDNLTVVPRPEGVLLGMYAMCSIFRLSPMLSILPAFSSPDLKVFLLLKKSFKSSAGGQGETV